MKLNSIKELINQYKTISSFVDDSSSLFTDQLFPPNQHSIFSTKSRYKNKNPSQIQSFLPHEKSFLISRYIVLPKDQLYEWHKLTEVDSNYSILSNPGPLSLINDVIQGEIGNCYFISALKYLSEVPKRISNIFQNQNQSGKANLFEVIVFINGLPSHIIVDNYFPMIESNLVFSRLNSTTNNIWPLILEKVWAKCNSSYEDTIFGCIADAFEFLTPAPIRKFYHDIKYDYLYEKISQAIDSGYIVCCDMKSINDNILLNKMGVISNHAYKIIAHGELVDPKGNQIKLLKIYNEFVTTSWNGNWSPYSLKWTSEYKKTLKYDPDSEKNTYWMNLNDYLKFYTTSYICYIHDDYYYSSKKIYIEINSIFTCVKFTVKVNTQGNSIIKLNHFIINVKSKRIKLNYKHTDGYQSPFVNVILFYKDKETLRFVDSVCGREDRLFISIPELAIGEYVLSVNFPLLSANSYSISKDFSINTSRPNSITVGLYSSIDCSKVSIQEYESNGFEKTILRSLIERSKKNYHVYFFEKEKEKETSRSINFENEKGAYGYLVLENKSEGILNEAIILVNFDNVNLISFLQNKKKAANKDISIPEDIDDEYTRKVILQVASIEKPVYETKITINSIPNKNSQIGKENAFQLLIQVAPQNTCVLIFEKCDEKSSIDILSQIVFYYPLYVILKENKFITGKNRLKYCNNPVEIYECIIEHSSGVVFYYKNKTKDMKAKIKVSFVTLNNLTFKSCNDPLMQSMTSLNENKEIEIMIEPLEQIFFEMRSNDIFETFSYSFQMNYQIFYAKSKLINTANSNSYSESII